MKLYHFRNEKFGLKSTEERRLKIARINKLNDPFELLGCALSDKAQRKVIKEVKETLSNNKGLVCFSKNWKNPVQWAHYADSHKVVCLGFEVAREPEGLTLGKINGRSYLFLGLERVGGIMVHDITVPKKSEFI